MEQYPEILVSHKAYPDLDNKVVSKYYFIRRTEENIYPLFEKYTPLELIDKILPYTTKRDVFVLSVTLFGYFEEKHLLLKVADKHLHQYWDRTMPDFPIDQIKYSIEFGCPLFFKAEKLFEYPFSFENEFFYLSFWHKPTIVNYWHFQLFTRDSNGVHLPREPLPGEKESKAESKRLRHLAIAVLEYIISKSICLVSETKKFSFENMLGT